ncbi:hypothetical protein MAPG_07011 [Magnaporthiopsis poae ATCC 64411]|uniref:Fibronectin type-III domain-containing protein n=1 Tax=Magnaporthiopsis poae (strain ATCC 64411 / 73-15) TaxID=644358 RepID=A0A0C4E3K8_MAGP6|nr:hypothetical protein MAPG_07011 [Magnaporthiopsis poae ATCC 64411]
MLWLSWTTAGPSLLLLCAIVAWWFTEPKTAQLNFIVLVGCFFFFWAVDPQLARDVPVNAFHYCAGTLRLLKVDSFLAGFVASNARMLFTGAAVVWLLRRASQTLWKPVPELIGILGLEVPDSPDVSLTGIAADKATLTWTRAQPSRPVQKFLIQVNGVNVGEIASNQDNFIIVSGLKPDHFYNVRVIAVGANNFQAGSRVIRLRTFARDGRPQLGNARLPSNFTPDEQGLSSQTEVVDENGAPRSPVPAVETAAVSEAAPQASTREVNPSSVPGMRRNTVGRRHSPSVATMDQPPPLPPPPPEAEAAEPTDAQMDLLGEKYKALLRETEELAEMMAREEEDHRQTLSEMEAEKQEKKKEQKKKEEHTEKLRREQGTTERLMRNALQRKSQKEKLLKEKQMERAKLAERVANFEKGIEEMRRDQASFAKEKEKLQAEKKSQENSFRSEVRALSTECSNMEAELKERRAQVKELEDARKKLPGGEDDAEWREQDAEARREWSRRERELHATLDYENKRTRQLDESTLGISTQLQQMQQLQQREFFAQSNSSAVEFGDGLSSQMKRRSRTGNSMSGVAVDPGMSREDAIRALTGDAPLSPTAKALLPSHIFLDMDEDDPSPDESPFVPPRRLGSPANDPQSPGSTSNKSMSMLSSPRGSTHNLPFPQYGEPGDRRSLISARDLGPPPLSSPPLPIAQPEGKGSSLASLLKFQRSRGSKPPEMEGPALGSLKPGQSQSFPRQSDEPENLANRRKLSLSSWNGMFNRNSTGPEVQPDPRIPPAASTTSRFSARNIFPFGGSRAPSGVFQERDPSSPRPASIASSDLPRPSTEGTSGIWGPLPADMHVIAGKTWPWSPPEHGWSRNPSRRPSIHGSPSVLKTTLASADDEILDEEALLRHGALPSQVGVIGSRPPGANKSLKTLNPAAPTFMTNLLFKSSKDKSKEGKGKDKDKGKTNETSTPQTGETSPADPRISRDGISVHTETSVSESRESLTLDTSLSNTLLDGPLGSSTPGSSKDGGHPDNVVKKLFRKSSSSKFSFTSRLGKKGPSSVSANSDTHGRSSMGDLDDAGLPVTSGLSPDYHGHGFGGSGGGDSSPSAAAAMFGRGVDSVTSSPSLGPSKFGGGNNSSSNNGKDKDNNSTSSSSAKDRPESRMSSSHRWFSMKKKGKEKESLELDRASVADSDGPPATSMPVTERTSRDF